MEAIFLDIKTTFLLFVTGLNWTFIFMYGFVIYGIKNEPEFEWYNELLKESKLKIWIAGFITMALFCLFKFLDPNSTFDSEYVSTLLRSFMVTIILSRVINNSLNRYIDKKINDKIDKL